jgi:hypothetical protein
MRLSDSRIALHARPLAAVQSSLPAINESVALSISIPLQRASMLSFFSLQQACQSQELFFSYTLFLFFFFIPKGLVLAVYTLNLITQSTNLSPVDINTKSKTQTQTTRY